MDVPYEPSQRCSWEASASISSLSPHLPYSSAGLFKRLKTTHLTTQSSSDDTLFQNAAKERLRHHDPVLKVEVWRKHERGQGDPVRTLQQPDIGPTESVQSHLSALNDGFFVSHATVSRFSVIRTSSLLADYCTSPTTSTVPPLAMVYSAMLPKPFSHKLGHFYRRPDTSVVIVCGQWPGMGASWMYQEVLMFRFLVMT